MPPTDRATCWSVTINNPSPSDEEGIALARQKGWKVEGQKEVGDNGTPHFQLMVKTPQVRFSALKKAFPRAHIEVAHNPTALEQYVHKEDTRVEGLSKSNELYPSQQKLFDLWVEHLLDTTKGQYLNWGSEALLESFDNAVRYYIARGYVIEGIAVNPQTRSAIKLYGSSIIERSIVRRQTDRQTDKDNIEVNNINAPIETFQEVEAPSQDDNATAENVEDK